MMYLKLVQLLVLGIFSPNYQTLAKPISDIERLEFTNLLLRQALALQQQGSQQEEPSLINSLLTTNTQATFETEQQQNTNDGDAVLVKLANPMIESPGGSVSPPIAAYPGQPTTVYWYSLYPYSSTVQTPTVNAYAVLDHATQNHGNIPTSTSQQQTPLEEQPLEEQNPIDKDATKTKLENGGNYEETDKVITRSSEQNKQSLIRSVQLYSVVLPVSVGGGIFDTSSPQLRSGIPEYTPVPVPQTYVTLGDGRAYIPAISIGAQFAATSTTQHQDHLRSGHENDSTQANSVPVTQYHALDPLGGYAYGYSNALSQKTEAHDPLVGATIGSYSYRDGAGVQQSVQYVADSGGFHVTGTNLPVAEQDAPGQEQIPVQVQDTAEVAAAKRQFRRMYRAAALMARRATEAAKN